MKTHRLKTWPVFFEEVRKLNKRFELRMNDRDFQAGDVLILEEWKLDDTEDANGHRNGNNTGRYLQATVTYVLERTSAWQPEVPPGLQVGWCILSLKDIKPIR